MIFKDTIQRKGRLFLTRSHDLFRPACANYTGITVWENLRQHDDLRLEARYSTQPSHKSKLHFKSPRLLSLLNAFTEKHCEKVCIEVFCEYLYQKQPFLVFFPLKQKLAAYQHVSPVYSSWKEPGNPTVPTTTVVFQSFPSVFTYIISFSYYPCLTANDSWLTNCWLED